jgi:serine protease inhibitor
MFLQKGIAVGGEFRRTLGAHYGADGRTVDFTAADEAKVAIDAWAAEQTADRIKSVFDRIDPTTVLVLANAIYFGADWTYPFPAVIGGQSFARADGSTVRTALMNQTANLRYAAGDGWQAVEMPYVGDAFAMWVLVPTGPVAGSKPGRLLAPETFAAVATGLKQTTVEVHLPRWDFETRPDLLDALGALGLTALGDFSGISPGIFLSDAVHAANITVDEWGTEAAAITALAFPLSARPRAQVVVRADRPFAFAIMHLPTRTPLFIGQVTDPTKS